MTTPKPTAPEPGNLRACFSVLATLFFVGLICATSAAHGTNCFGWDG